MKWLKKVAATPLTSVARVIDSLAPIANDRNNAPSIRAVRDAVSEAGQFVYPIGAIYLSVNDTNPHDIFGGTWVRIKDCFLLASGNTYTNGDTGGEATHTLTVDELAAHTHALEGDAKVSGEGNNYIAFNADDSVGCTVGTSANIRGAQGVTGLEVTGTAQSAGGGQAHNNMPPYLVVNVWYRTA